MPDDVDQALWKTTLYGLAAGAFVAPIALGTEVRWLRHPAMIWLGEVSYEFFLVHVLVMDWVMKTMGYQTFQGSMLAVAIVTTVITLPLSWLLRRITDVLTRRPGPASPWATYRSSSSSGPSSATSTSCATFIADSAAGAPQ